MAKSNDPKRRYEIINACLTDKNRTHTTIHQIMKALAAENIKVSKRTVEYDIENMRFSKHVGLYAPIEYCLDNLGYSYKDPDYTIKRELTDKDRSIIKAATNALKKFSGVPYLNQFQSAIYKALKVFDQSAGDEQYEDIIHFESNVYNKGLEHYEAIHKACCEKRPLSIQYTKFDHPTSKHVVHPYNLKEYKGWWYLFCYGEEREKIVIFALDRMGSVTNAKHISFKPNTFYNPDEYFKYIIGVTRFDSDPETIELLFTRHQGHYIKAHHLHWTQKTVRDDDQGLLITLKLVPNVELKQLILGFGEEVTVMKPESLRQQMADSIEKMASKYRS